MDEATTKPSEEDRYREAWDDLSLHRNLNLNLVLFFFFLPVMAVLFGVFHI